MRATNQTTRTYLSQHGTTLQGADILPNQFGCPIIPPRHKRITSVRLWKWTRRANSWRVQWSTLPVLASSESPLPWVERKVRVAPPHWPEPHTPCTHVGWTPTPRIAGVGPARPGRPLPWPAHPTLPQVEQRKEGQHRTLPQLLVVPTTLQGYHYGVGLRTKKCTSNVFPSSQLPGPPKLVVKFLFYFVFLFVPAGLYPRFHLSSITCVHANFQAPTSGELPLVDAKLIVAHLRTQKSFSITQVMWVGVVRLVRVRGFMFSDACLPPTGFMNKIASANL